MSPNTILSIICALCLIQGNESDPINDTIAALTLQISSTKATIDLTIQNGAIQIRQTRATIGRTINQADATIQNQLTDLDNIVHQAEDQAQQKSLDISNCVNQVSSSVSDLEVGRIQICANNHDLDLVATEFGSLRVIKKELSGSVHVCLGKNPNDSESLKSCVQSDIDGAKEKIGEIQEKIDSVCNDAKAVAKSCVEGVVKDLNQTVSKVVDDFKECVSGIL